MGSADSYTKLESLETNLRLVMKFINASRDKNKLSRIIETDKGYERLDMLSAQVINAVTDFGLTLDREEETVNMCQAIIDIRSDSERIGEARGKAIGEARGRLLERLELIKGLLSNGVSLDIIAKSANLTVDEVKRLAAQITHNEN